MAPLFEHYGIGLWMPEIGGRVDWHAEDHEQTMLALGLSSKREITRTRIRVRTAMAAQTQEQGRYLGGRPPYGYRLGDAGPHPNKAHAAWGRRAHRLEPDPVTAPVVRWMFAQRLAGHSAARITRVLNDAGVPCPSAADPGRNRCRHGYSSATVPDPARPKNAYVREDQVLPHLAALAILLAGDARQGPGNRALAQLTGPACTAAMIDRLRAAGTVLTYDPDEKTVRAGDRDAPAVLIAGGGQHRAGERRTA
jgi:hypothetical protein